MKKKKSLYLPIIITLLLLGCLGTGVWLFANAVGRELWTNSIKTVAETTRQKANAIQSLLDDDFSRLSLLKDYLSDKPPENLGKVVSSCQSVDPDVFFIFWAIRS